MVFLAYALFIIALAIHYLVLAAIAAGFFGGAAYVATGLSGGRPSIALLGVLLMATSVLAAMMISYWAKTPPPDDGAKGPHHLIYQTYQGMRVRNQATRWMADGTFERLAEEQRRRDGEGKPAAKQDSKEPPAD